ncbi:unnamed protein product [Urochloa humidicola]
MVHSQPQVVPQPQYSTAGESVQRDNHSQDQFPTTTPPQMDKDNPPSPAPGQGRPAGAAVPPLAATGAADEQPPAAGIQMGQPRFQPAQAYVQPQVLNGTLQYPVEAPQIGVEIPVPVLPAEWHGVLPTAPPAAPAQGNGLSTVVRNEFVRATIRLAGKAAEHALFSNSTATTGTTAGDILLSMVTDPTGADAGPTYCGDSAV